MYALLYNYRKKVKIGYQVVFLIADLCAVGVLQINPACLPPAGKPAGRDMRFLI